MYKEVLRRKPKKKRKAGANGAAAAAEGSDDDEVDEEEDEEEEEEEVQRMAMPNGQNVPAAKAGTPGPNGAAPAGKDPVWGDGSQDVEMDGPEPPADAPGPDGGAGGVRPERYVSALSYFISVLLRTFSLPPFIDMP